MARERERTLPELEDPAWGPVADEAPAGARPLGAWGSADAGGVSFAGARIDTLLLCGGAIARPGAVRFGSRQARRLEELGIRGANGRRTVFTASLSPDQIEYLSTRSWVRYLVFSKQLQPIDEEEDSS